MMDFVVTSYCATGAEFEGSSRPAKVLVRYGTEPEVVLSNGSGQVFTVSSLEREVTTIHRFPGRVVHVESSTDGRSLHALCENEGVYLARVPQRSRTPSSTPPAGDGSGLVPVKVALNSCVIRDPQICSFMVVQTERVLVTVALGDAVWRFCLYEVPDVPSPGYKQLAELRLPTLAGALSGGAGGLPALSCIRARGPTSQPLTDHGHFFLEPAIFSLLFGVDASLVSSPMILCGLPDGRLCCLPLLLLGGSGVRVLHSLEQPITFIGTSGRTERGPRCLLVVGRYGRVLLVQAEEGAEAKAARFRECRVSGPVECACVSDTHLYYSTCADLLGLPLTELPSPGLHTPLSLNVSRVLALAPPTQDPTGALPFRFSCDSFESSLTFWESVHFSKSSVL